MAASHPRYKKGIVTSVNVNIVQVRNPHVVMWWSAVLPGYGHVMLCFIKGAGFSLLDGTFAWGTVFSLFGVIYGFILTGGPVMRGLIGLFAGWGFGFLFDLWLRKKQYRMKKKKGEGEEVVLVVHCTKEQVTKVKEILFDHYTLGLQVIEE